MAGKKASNHYLNNEDLLREVKLSKEIQDKHPDWTPGQCLTRNLVYMLITLVDNYSSKASFRNYSYLEDMKAEALMALCNNALKFDADNYSRPFSYFSKIIYFSFLTSLDKEKKVRNLRDKLMEAMEMTPSMTRQIENEMSNNEEFK